MTPREPEKLLGLSGRVSPLSLLSPLPSFWRTQSVGSGCGSLPALSPLPRFRLGGTEGTGGTAGSGGPAGRALGVSPLSKNNKGRTGGTERGSRSRLRNVPSGAAAVWYSLGAGPGNRVAPGAGEAYRLEPHRVRIFKLSRGNAVGGRNCLAVIGAKLCSSSAHDPALAVQGNDKAFPERSCVKNNAAS